MSDYTSYKKKEYSCHKCSWRGLGEQTEILESFEEVFEIGCPECSACLGAVSYQPVAEQVELNKEIKKRQTPELKSVDQLPDIDSDEIIITIKEVTPREFALFHGDTEIWREGIVYEYYKKYLVIGEILIEKYGDRLADFDYSQAGELYLGHFTGSMAVSQIQNLRKKIQQNYEAKKQNGINKE